MQFPEEIKRLLIVCKANYCRSPVAKFLLQKKIETIVFDSAGIIPFSKNSMDVRSQKFLQENDINDQYHIPKLITQEHLLHNNLILTMDFEVHSFLLKKFSNHSKKIFPFNFPDKRIIIRDPYKYFDEREYEEVMVDINYLSDKWREIIID